MVWFPVEGHLFCSLPNPTLLNSNRLAYIELQWPLICSLFYLRLPFSHFSCHWLRLTWPYQAHSCALQGPVVNPCWSILLLITHVQFPSLSSCVLINMHILRVPLWLWTQWNCINHVYWSMLMPSDAHCFSTSSAYLWAFLLHFTSYLYLLFHSAPNLSWKLNVSQLGDTVTPLRLKQKKRGLLVSLKDEPQKARSQTCCSTKRITLP